MTATSTPSTDTDRRIVRAFSDEGQAEYRALAAEAEQRLGDFQELMRRCRDARLLILNQEDVPARALEGLYESAGYDALDRALLEYGHAIVGAFRAGTIAFA